jgi:alpha-beta hydrolase superfamily lysophospholipase
MLVTGTGEPAKPFLQIAEYLSNRGFAVLRYNKRGVGLEDRILDLDVYLNKTYSELQGDVERALEVLMQLPEVDTSDITLIGHSEGTIIAPRIAIGNPDVKNVVLLSAGAQNLREIMFFQMVDRRIIYVEEVVDTDDDGLMSVEEVSATFETPLVYLSPQPPQGLLDPQTNFTDWYPGIDANEDGFIGIHEEYEPLLLQIFEFVTTFTYHEKGGVTLELVAQNPFDNPWMEEHYALEPNVALIGNVSASILILQGEGDTQTPVGQAFLLEQRLTEMEHPDHTLITYPGLGHSFYPLPSPWIQPLGPIQEYVLSDLAAWLKDSAREVRYLNAQIQANADTVENLQGQLADLNSELNLQTGELESARAEISELQGRLDAETQRLGQELQASRDEASDIETRLTNDIDRADLKIGDLESQTKDLQAKSSGLENTVAGLESRNSELRSALDTSTNLAYIAIGIAAATVIAAILTRRR